MWDILLHTQGDTHRVAFSNGTVSLSIMSLPYLRRSSWERKVNFYSWLLKFIVQSAQKLQKPICILIPFTFLWELLNNTFLLNTQTCLVSLSHITSELMQELQTETVLYVCSKCARRKKLPATESSKCRSQLRCWTTAHSMKPWEHFPQAVRHTRK